MKNQQKRLNVISIICCIVLFISVVPILYNSFFAHPVYDDFGFSAGVHHVVEKGGNVFDVIGAGVDEAKEIYNIWQGTYAADFIFAMQPGAFSDDLYFITTFVMLGFVIFGTIFLFNTICDKLNVSKSYGVIVSTIILFVSIQFIIDKNQSFYWWNGSSYYTLFYAFSLILFALLIKICNLSNRVRKYIDFVLALLLVIIIGGGNYSTALMTAVILFFSVLYLFIKKSNDKYLIGILFIVLLGCMMVSILAPGNALRAQECDGINPVKAVLKSVYFTFQYLGVWTKLPQIITFVCITPLIYNAVKGIKFDFKYPLVFVCFSWLVFATQLTPTLYTINSVGAVRQENIYYYAYYIFVVINIAYICGWVSHSGIIEVKISQNINKKIYIATAVCMALMFYAGCYDYGIENLTTIDTTLAIKNGLSVQYDKEYEGIIKDIKAGKKKVNDIKTKPGFLTILGINEDPGFWTNMQISEYYNVGRIKLKN